MDKELKFIVNVDDLTIDDMADLETLKMAKIVPILKRIVKIGGVPEEEQAEQVGKLSWRSIKVIAREINNVVQAEINPEDDMGKN